MQAVYSSGLFLVGSGVSAQLKSDRKCVLNGTIETVQVMHAAGNTHDAACSPDGTRHALDRSRGEHGTQHNAGFLTEQFCIL